MKTLTRSLTVLALLQVSIGAFAANAVEPLSGLPLPPDFLRTGDPIQTYSYCGKSARAVIYMGGDFDDVDQEGTWFARAIPGAHAFTAVGGVKTYVSADGTVAVEAAGAIISYFRFSPGLSAAEMKILGNAPAARSCIAD